MKKLKLIFLIIGILGIVVVVAEKTWLKSSTTFAQTTNYDWPQVGNNPQHTGYSPETLGTNFKVKWTKAFQPDKVYPQVQAIVYQGKVFVGTEGANGQKPSVYALDAVTGSQIWKFEAGGPILGSVAAADGKIFFAAMDGAVYAIDANTGQQIWKNQLLWRHGFSASAVVAENKVLIGGRDGKFYALDLNGNKLWEFNAGAPLYQTAAYNNGRVYFGAMDMYFYALNTANGTLAWKSQKTQGMAFKDYWPVVHQGKVLVRAMAMYPQKNFYAFDEDSGTETISLPQYDAQTMNGATTPPCVDRDGYLVVPAQKPDGSYPSGWGRLSLSTQGLFETLVDSNNPSLGFGNNDENMNPTCAANLIFGVHRHDGYFANFTGAFDLNLKKWIPFSFGHTNKQMSSNTQGGGASPVSISNGMFYHLSWHELIARTTQ